MKTLEQRISALESCSNARLAQHLSGELVETILAKLRAEWSLPLEEQLENLRNRPVEPGCLGESATTSMNDYGRFKSEAWN